LFVNVDDDDDDDDAAVQSITDVRSAGAGDGI